MLTEFRNFCQKWQLFQQGETVVVAVSGGLDSVVLLHLLRQMAPLWNLQLVVAHLDHGLRGDSQLDAQFVQELAAQKELPLDIQVLEVESLQGPGESLEMAARRIRYDFLRKVASRRGACSIALGHHRDDQAETLLYRMARGTGISGLAGIRPRNGDLVRPLLFASRRELRIWAEREGLRWREDPSNTDLRFQRNLIRHQMLTVFQQLNPKYDAAVGALAEQVALEEDFWKVELDRRWPGMVRDVAEGRPVLKQRAVAGEHPALRLRVYRRLLELWLGTLQGIDRGHLRQLDRLVLSGEGEKTLDIPSLQLTLDAGEIFPQSWVTKQSIAPFSWEPGQTLEVPGRARLVWEEALFQGNEEKGEFFLDPLTSPSSMTVRSRLPGDRIVLKGVTGRKKIQDLFVDERIPRWKRESQLLVAEGSDILWVPGIRKADLPRPELGKRAWRLVWQPFEGETFAL